MEKEKQELVILIGCIYKDTTMDRTFMAVAKDSVFVYDATGYCYSKENLIAV